MVCKFIKVLITILFICLTLKVGTGVASANASTSIMEGAWLGEWANSSTKNIENFNQVTNSKAQIIQTFMNTSQTFNQISSVVDYVYSQGALNLITIEPIGYTTADINKGKLDNYFKTLAQSMKSWNHGQEMWVRFMHEMNGNWYSWSIGDSRVNTNQSYINAYQRVVNIFRSAGATNIKWVYSVNSENIGKGSTFTGSYPGDNYIDYVAADGYNWGNTKAYSQWKSFRQVFDQSYAELSKINKPFLITEWASTENGGDKAVWIKDAFTQIKGGAYGKLKATVWFNENKETDWRIWSSTSSLNAYINR